jgi:A/G-specific adenine glycosylase
LVTPLLRWFGRNARDLPWRRTQDPYAIWVSEIMLQQTQVKTVIPYFERWMRELPTIAALARADSGRIHKLWEGLGYYTRVRNLQSAAQLVVARHAGKFPTDPAEILALPGIGRYTAGAICSIAFNQPVPILDGNVIRVLTRVFGIRDIVRDQETTRKLWALAEELVQSSSRVTHPMPPLEWLAGTCSALNQSLMELGATVCTPRNPACDQCPVARFCVARVRNWIEETPNLGARVTSTARQYAACVLERNGTLLVRQRPGGTVNAHLWEFPNVEVPLKSSKARKRKGIETELGVATGSFTPLLTVRHSITRYRITLEAFRATLNGTSPGSTAGRWLSADDLIKLPFTSAHRRILTAALRPTR